MAQLITEKTDVNFKWENKKIDIDISQAGFELDALQQELINRYLRTDRNFLRAFHTNYTSLFFQFIKDKVRLSEPYGLSLMGQTRSGKSVSAITIAGLTMESKGRLMDINHIVSDEYKFMDNLKNEEITKFGDAFVIDESKQAVFGVGSTAKKVKLVDIQNIIAVNNISTLWLKPDGWSFEGSMYGLRAFGRAQFYKDGKPLQMRINRFMLYNLQESSAGGSLPLGMVYLPHFEDILKNGKQLWKQYTAKKQDWVDAEQKGQADTLIESMFKVAEKIAKFPKFQNLKGTSQKKVFIITALGSETPKGEIDQIYNIIKLIDQGFSYNEIHKFMKR